MSKLNFCVWCAAMSRSSQSSMTSPANILNRGSNKAQDARLDIHARGFWERHSSAFFDVRVRHPNAVSYRDLEPQQIYRIHENEEKRLYSRRVLEIEHGTFTPLVFTTAGGMGLKECLIYHSRLAQLIAIKRGALCQNHLMDHAIIKRGAVCQKPSHGSEPEPHSHS